MADPNQHILSRTQAVTQKLMAAYQSEADLPSGPESRDREIFVSHFLKEVFPPIYRFGSGNITDIDGNRSGPLDVVVERPLSPSLPAAGGDEVRLYPAESVALVIEVKSDLRRQWDEVEQSLSALAPIHRQFHTLRSMSGWEPKTAVPVVAVGFSGWRTLHSVKRKLARSRVDAMLIIDEGIFVARAGGHAVGHDVALWGLISYINEVISVTTGASHKTFDYLVNGKGRY